MDEEQTVQEFDDAGDLLKLALQARDGDPLALGDLVQRTRFDLFAIAYAELRNYDDAHDAVAEALIQICLHINAIRHPESIAPWMRAIVRNEVRRMRRNSQSNRGSATLPLLEIDDAMPAFADASQLRLDIERAMRQLSTRQEEAVRLFYFAGLPVEDISAQLHVAPATVRQWLHRGRLRLAANMKGYGPVTKESADRPREASLKARFCAGIVHSDLSQDLIRSLTNALEAGGYEVTMITAEELEPFRENLLNLVQYVTERGKDLLIFDEKIGDRSALEYVINLRGPRSQRTNIPFCVLWSGPHNYFGGSALFGAGVDRLLRKDAPEEIAAFAAPFRVEPKSPLRFTKPFNAATRIGQAEAARRGLPTLDTGLTLWGMLKDAPDPPSNPDRPIVHLLSERLDIPAEKIRAVIDEIEARPQTSFSAAHFLFTEFGLSAEQIITVLESEMPEISVPILKEDVALGDDTKEAIDFCSEEYSFVSAGRETESGVRGIGTEHLLLAIIRTRHGAGSQVLTKLGVGLDDARDAVRRWLDQNGAPSTEPS